MNKMEKSCLNVDCGLAVAEFENAQHTFPEGIKEIIKNSNTLVKQWVVKARCYQRGGAFFTAIMYYGMSIWHICFTPGLPENVKKFSEELKIQMQSCRNQLESQWKDQQKSQAAGDEPVTQWEVTPKEELLDKITGNPQSFETLSGAENSKSVIRKKFILPNVFPDLYYSENNNVLLYGPPGTGKTMLAQACVNEIEKVGGNLVVNFYSLTASSARSKWEGGTEKNLEALFQQANDLAKKISEDSSNPRPSKSVLFIDEVESLAGDRSGPSGGDRALTTLLQLMDGFKAYPNVIILAATNRPWDLDPAFLRRFAASVFVDLEDFSGRQELVENSFFSRFQKTGGRNFNLKPRLCSLMIEESEQSLCDTTWQKYKGLFSRNDVTIEEYLGDAYKKIDDNESDESRCKRIFWYFRFLEQDNISDLLRDATSIARIKLNLKTYIERKVNGFIEKIKISLESSPDSCNKDCNFSQPRNKAALFNAMVMFHYISEITGPSLEAVKSKYVTSRKPSILAKSSWGYSNSDLVRLVREIFSNTATRILETKFKPINCTNPKNCKETKCFEKTGPSESGAKNYVECRLEAAGNDFKFSSNSNNDMYGVVTVDDVCNALRNPDIDTTTGNVDDYCSFLQYSLTKTYRNVSEQCALTTKGHFEKGKHNSFMTNKNP
jgi:DNA replication protein DnaC